MSAPLVAVAQGGTSVEREVSVRGGQRVRQALERTGYHAVALELDHTAVEALHELRPGFVFVVAHGGEGEGGGLQSLLEVLEIPYTGSDSLTSTLCLNKVLTKRLLIRAGLPTPEFHPFSRKLFNGLGAAAALPAVEQRLPRPVVVKPARGGSSFGLRVLTEADQLRQAILSAIAYDDEILIERYVEGRELAVTVLGPETEPRALPVVEIVSGDRVYDYEAHYEMAEARLVGAELADEVRAAVVDIATRAYATLGCRDIARVDMILDHQDQPQILELNTIPGLTETGPTPFAADLAGMSFDELVLALADRVARGAITTA